MCIVYFHFACTWNGLLMYRNKVKICVCSAGLSLSGYVATTVVVLTNLLKALCTNRFSIHLVIPMQHVKFPFIPSPLFSFHIKYYSDFCCSLDPSAARYCYTWCQIKGKKIRHELIFELFYSWMLNVGVYKHTILKYFKTWNVNISPSHIWQPKQVHVCSFGALMLPHSIQTGFCA